MLLAGCKDLKSELEKRARANSLRKTNPQTKLAANGCPPGLVPRGKTDSSGRPEFCESAQYDGSGVERIGEDWPKPKVRYILQGDLLRVSRYYQNGNPQSESHFADNVKQGESTEWYKDRTLKSKGIYRGDKEHGLFKRYHSSGKPKEVGTYQQGMRQGLWTFFDKAGRIRHRTEFRLDLRHGNSETFDLAGVRVAHGSFDRDKKNGRWLTYYPDSKPKMAGSYAGGLKEGKWTTYYPTGKVQAVAYYKENRVVPKQTLRGEVAFRRGDILGARPPVARDNKASVRTPQKLDTRKPMTKGKGWRPL